jgi:4-amino-4-deoxy-L-arabinose transferase-like glycosyltransferase
VADEAVRAGISPSRHRAHRGENRAMSRPAAFAIVVLLWAAIHLPGLGSTELKGEEGRRILPAIAMLESGDWLVPHLGGEPYLRKPPLVNWAIALSFKVTGVRNEWTARLPSALCVLALGLTIVAVSGRGWLDLDTSFIAALMAMTQFGLLAKAKFAGAEIEGLYAPLTGMAIVCWLAWHAQGRSPWLVWCVPGALLGLACLAKGPSLHLLYYYAIVLAVLWRRKEMRQLWHPAHFAGLALCAAIFAAWAVPYFRSPEAAAAAAVWKRQGLDRFTESDFNLRNYLTNIPRALGDQLPWLLLLLPLWRRTTGGPPVPPTPDRRAAGGTLRAVALAVADCFFAVLLIPGTLPRYVLPLGAPIALLLAAALEQSGRVAQPVRLVVRLTAIIAAAMILYALFVVPRLNARDDLRPLAAQIDAAIPSGDSLILHDIGYQPAIFYLRTPYRYAPRTEDIPRDSRWVVARASERRKLETQRPDLRFGRSVGGEGKGELLLFQRRD